MLDNDLDASVQGCVACQKNASALPAKYVLWPMTDQVWEQIHINYAGPVEGNMLLIIVDAKTKWLEVVQVSSTPTSVIIMILYRLFSRFRIPKAWSRTMVLDSKMKNLEFFYLSMALPKLNYYITIHI